MDHEHDDIFTLGRDESRLATRSDLRYIARELEITTAIDPDAQLMCLGLMTTLSRVATHWLSPSDNLRGRLQAVAQIARRLAWRHDRPVDLIDVPPLAKAGDMAAQIPNHQFLSVRTQETARFNAVLAELDLRWGYRGDIGISRFCVRS